MPKSMASGVMSRINMRPMMVAPSFIDNVAAAIDCLASADTKVENKAQVEGRDEILAMFGHSRSTIADKPYAFVDGLAFIPVSGMLINRFNSSWAGYVTGYNFIRSMLNAAMADPDVKGVVFDMNSYGGEVSGCFELAEDIYATRGIKPTLAVVDSNCYSACYAIASACSKIKITPSGGSGSIGAITSHMSYQRALEEDGVKVTLVYSGSHKADGNPYNDLTDDVKMVMQAGVDATRQKFAATVARNRGLEVQVVLDTEARSYRAEDALALGLVDAIEAPDKVLNAFFNELSSSDNEQESNMSVDATVPSAAGSAESAEAARVAERNRISAIMSCDEAKGRPALANKLALGTSMSAEDAKGILAAAATETPAAAPVAATANAFENAMNSTPNPGIGADQEASAGVKEVKPKTSASAILAAQAKATGVDLKVKG